MKKSILAISSKNNYSDSELYATGPTITNKPSTTVTCTVVELTESLLGNSQENGNKFDVNEHL